MGIFDGIIKSGKTPKVQDYFTEIDTPSIVDMEIQLQQLVQQGVMTPEQAQAAYADASAMNGITLDPNLKQNQMAALASLQEISSNGGMTNMDKVNLSKINDQENTVATGKRDAIISNAQQRGIGGSSIELMAQLQNAQASAGRTAQRDMDVTAQAQQRALDALIAGGNMSSQLVDQSFNQQAQTAQANDNISRFNATNRQNINMTNTAANNAAQSANLNNKQNVADANVGMNNQQQQYNRQLQQQNYENQLKKAQGQSGISSQNAANAGADSQGRANANNQLIGGLLGVGSAYLGKKAEGGLVMGDPSDQDTMPHMLMPGEHVVRKEDVPEMMKKKHTDDNGQFDAAGMLDELTGYKYNYKGKK